VRLHMISMHRVWRGLSKMGASMSRFSSILVSCASRGCVVK
jgi:hypothetical protein